LRNAKDNEVFPVTDGVGVADECLDCANQNDDHNGGACNPQKKIDEADFA
jgi:hypothetical protein